MSTKKLRKGKNILPALSPALDINSIGFAPDTDLSKLSPDNRIIVDLMMRKMDEVKRELMSKLDEKDEKIEEMNKQVGSLKSEVRELKTRLEDVESFQRGDSLIFSGEALPQVGDN